MNIRKLRFPQDIDELVEVTMASFQYPENPEWSIQEDEVAELYDQINGIKRYWPLLRVGMLFSSELRYLLMGYACEVDGKMAGTMLFQRRKSTELVYYINNVAVDPSYRRRGIARKMVETALEDMRSSGGVKVMLDVIDGNLPAYRLYEKLGWEHFSGDVHLDYDEAIAEKKMPETPLPGGYALVDVAKSDWRTDFHFAQRVIPERVQQYDPVEEARFKEGLLMRLLEPLSGVKQAKLALRDPEGNIAAMCGYRYRTRTGGINHARLIVHPEHMDSAPAFIGAVNRKVCALAPGRRVELMVPSWLPDVIAAAEGLGFSRRFEYHRMGLFLS